MDIENTVLEAAATIDEVIVAEPVKTEKEVITKREDGKIEVVKTVTTVEVITEIKDISDIDTEIAQYDEGITNNIAAKDESIASFDKQIQYFTDLKDKAIAQKAQANTK